MADTIRTIESVLAANGYVGQLTTSGDRILVVMGGSRLKGNLRVIANKTGTVSYDYWCAYETSPGTEFTMTTGANSRNFVVQGGATMNTLAVPTVRLVVCPPPVFVIDASTMTAATLTVQMDFLRM